MSYYIFIIKGIPIAMNESISAEVIANTLISNDVWIFRENTPNMKKLKIGDKILIYCGGKEKKFFTHVIEITRDIQPFRKINNIFNSEINQVAKLLGLNWMSLFAGVKAICEFEEPILIKPLIQSLHFIKQKRDYGLHLRLPIVSISEEDYKCIVGCHFDESSPK